MIVVTCLHPCLWKYTTASYSEVNFMWMEIKKND